MPFSPIQNTMEWIAVYNMPHFFFVFIYFMLVIVIALSLSHVTIRIASNMTWIFQRKFHWAFFFNHRTKCWTINRRSYEATTRCFWWKTYFFYKFLFGVFFVCGIVLNILLIIWCTMYIEPGLICKEYTCFEYSKTIFITPIAIVIICNKYSPFFPSNVITKKERDYIKDNFLIQLFITYLPQNITCLITSNTCNQKSIDIPLFFSSSLCHWIDKSKYVSFALILHIKFIEKKRNKFVS